LPSETLDLWPTTVKGRAGVRGGNWELVAVEDIGIDSETASGIPSLDGNGDGLTAFSYSQLPRGGVFTFGDNTVGA
jgi:hypothetical protein